MLRYSRPCGRWRRKQQQDAVFLNAVGPFDEGKLRLFSYKYFACSFDQRPGKPLTTFGQKCGTMCGISFYREHTIASEVCNSDT